MIGGVVVVIDIVCVNVSTVVVMIGVGMVVGTNNIGDAVILIDVGGNGGDDSSWYGPDGCGH